MIARFLLLALVVASSSAFHASAAGNPEKTRQFIAVLKSDAPLFDKARACQQLGECGGKEAVPALAALLNDAHLGAYARSGLEGIADPSAADALRAALDTVQGVQLAGVINSLGALRDAKAAGPLRMLAENPNSGVVKEALLALGRMATVESVQFLRRTLAEGAETVRPDTAAACLLAAEKQLADGQAETAVALYDAVRGAKVPAAFRMGATRGAILARKSDGTAFLVEQLRSDDRVVRHAALIVIREIPSDALAHALNAELETAEPELQIQLLTALLDCHNPQSLPVIRAKVGGANPEVRKTALSVLGRIGGSDDAGVLLKTVAENRNPDESALALNALGRMEGPAVDGQILQALSSAAEASVRVKLIRLAESREMTNAVGVLLQQAAQSDAKVAAAAFFALKALAGPGELAALIVLTKACQDETVRYAAENAVCGACLKTGDGQAGAETILAELRRTTEPSLKNSWIRILASLGCAQALPDIKAAMADTDETVAVNAIDQLGRWPGATPIEDLLAVVESGASEIRRKRALSAAVQLAVSAAEERQHPDSMVVGWLRRADKAAQSLEEKRPILSGLGRLRHVESLRALAPYLDDPKLRPEAALAVVQIAPALAKSADAAELKAVLRKVVAVANNPEVRGQAEKVAASIPDKNGPIPLFNGRSLAGWEGSTNVWRVRDGVIVGGSLDGNPRNEFLATDRSHTNFLLRLEYKLIGTEGFVNGGVQFRSVRMKQPANEMYGYQADIGAGYSGCLYDESRRNKFLARGAEEAVKRLEKSGDWNRYEVRCEGRRIRIALNGEQTVDYIESDQTIPQEGLIGLQIHGSCKAEISFRNLTIEDLP